MNDLDLCLEVVYRGHVNHCLTFDVECGIVALYRECLAGAQIIFLESGRGLGHVTPTIFGSTVVYPSDSLASCHNCFTDVISWKLELCNKIINKGPTSPQMCCYRHSGV